MDAGVKTLVDTLRFGRRDDRRDAIRRLSTTDAEVAVQALGEAIGDPDPEVARLARIALGGVEERLNRDILALRDEIRKRPDSALAYAALYCALLDISHAVPRDGAGYVVGRDFLNFWMAGRAAWAPDPARFYDLATYQAEIARIVGPGYPGQVWSYPPSIIGDG